MTKVFFADKTSVLIPLVGINNDARLKCKHANTDIAVNRPNLLEGTQNNSLKLRRGMKAIEMGAVYMLRE